MEAAEAAETASVAMAELSIGPAADAGDVHAAARKSSCSMCAPLPQGPAPAACAGDEGGEADASAPSKAAEQDVPFPLPLPGLGGRLRRPVVAVVGSGREPHAHLAAPLGRWLASIGVHLLTGGGRGVMEEVSRHFVEVEDRKGLAIGVLPTMPGHSRAPPGYPNQYVELAIQTHLPLGRDPTGSQSRSHVNIMSADVVVALPGARGTWSEVQLASFYRRPIVLLLGEEGRSLACKTWAYRDGEDGGAGPQARACPCDATAPQCACGSGGRRTCMGLPIAFDIDEVQAFVTQELAQVEARRARQAAREAAALAEAAASPRRGGSCGASAVRPCLGRTRSTSI